jgi:hypothetical protein
MDFLEINLSDAGFELSYGIPRASYVSTEDFSLILSIDRNEAYQPHEVYGLSKVFMYLYCLCVVLLL